MISRLRQVKWKIHKIVSLCQINHTNGFWICVHTERMSTYTRRPGSMLPILLVLTRSLAHFTCTLAWGWNFFSSQTTHFDATANQLCDVLSLPMLLLLLFAISFSHVNIFRQSHTRRTLAESNTYTSKKKEKKTANQRIYDTNRWENLKHACNQHKRINTGKYLNGIGKIMVTFLMGKFSIFRIDRVFVVFFRIEIEMCFSFD